MAYGLGRTLSVVVLAMLPAPSHGSEPYSHDQAVFGFAGALTRENIERSANPFVDYESNAVIGFGYQTFLHHDRDFSFGLEAGLAARLGGTATAEGWAGGVVRYDGFIIADKLKIAPALTVGLSAVTGAHPGRERDLQERYDGDARLLFYLGPEINVSVPHRSNTEVFWRLHHRSGGGQTLGGMRGAANANVVGLRYRF